MQPRGVDSPVYRGALAAEIIPELWLLARHHTQLRGRVSEQHVQDLAIFTTEPEETMGTFEKS
jgi:hypothetical protein